jgi:cell wall-associated NlpC family hydrolase
MSTTKIVTTAAVAVILPIVLIAAAADAIVSVLTGRSRLDCAPAGSPAAGLPGYGSDQMTNAATIVALGKQLNVPEQGWVVAIAAAMTESGLRNLDHGDRDSLGLFQQRPSQGWGTPAQIMNPTYSATQFYQHLLALRGWQQMSVNDAAQAVERSGYPNAYAQHELAAREIIGAVHGFTCTTTGGGNCDRVQTSNSTALVAIDYACRQRGLPYVWGGNGPQSGEAGFDCSGLTHAAYAAAGIILPRTADAQYRVGPHVPTGQPLLPGDLVFYGTEQHIHHVGLYLGGGLMIDAPDFGQVVKTEPYTATGYLGATRPVGYVAAQT